MRLEADRQAFGAAGKALELAQGAFQRAYYEALTTSGKVMRAVDGKLVETYADGTETVIRSIHSPIKVTLGTKITLQHRPTVAQ